MLSSKKRNFPSFVEAFTDYTANLPSSTIWRKWAAIGTLAGTLERKIWTYTLGSNLYPNLYIWLIGPPAAGKTVLTSIVSDLWASVGPSKVNIAPTSCSAQSFVDALRAGEKSIIKPPEIVVPIRYNTVSAAINELGVFLKHGDNEMVAIITDLYDGKRWSERKRTANIEYTLEHPCVNMIGCGTPSWLGEVLPEGAWQQGLMSRVQLVYNSIVLRPSLFSDKGDDAVTFAKLKEDLNRVAEIVGMLTFTKEAKAALVAWYEAGNPPTPTHPRLETYLGRRTAKVIKLCQIAYADSPTGDMQINLDHYNTALGWLLETERFMPDIFEAMTTGGQTEWIRELWLKCFKYLEKYGTGCPESLVYEWLSGRMVPSQIKPFMDGLKQSGLFKVKLDNKNPDIRLWVPAKKEEKK